MESQDEMSPDSGGPPRPRERGSFIGPIIAISATGAVAKANLQARRILPQDSPLESTPLGALVAPVLARHSRGEQVLLSVPDDEGGRHEVLLVLSDQLEPLPRPLAGGDEPEAEPAGAAEAADEAHGNVADFIAHELRNNIAITLGLSQLLETSFESIDASDRIAALKGIQAEAEHALMVLDGLLKLVESRRKPELAMSSVPLHSVIRTVIADHKRRHPERVFSITGDAPVFATGNSTWIRLAIANLIANAEKVTPRERAIQVNVLQEADRAIVLILDQGQALTTPVYNALWEIYSKGPPAGIEITGSGIGLSLCKELVEAMGGKVWAGPRHSGGSAFAISLHSVAEAVDSDMAAP